MIPEDLKYTREHEWLRMEDDLAVVGITDYAQRELGDVVFVDLPAVGSTVQQGEIFGSIDSVKTASDLYSPISGEVVEINSALADDPALVNTDPYGKGWMIKVRPRDESELDNLLTPQEYREYVREE
ncbi:glycine cleavage system H protein [Thermobaculum terrenum ATCC BAA-798]|uniref:Glycine cleavage system H protein n=1 Tax=Thermobaculum terrenum (strain ATCC BAA-798 / CCMEE 7001 / YNP1) TaxID=525904 RepID=D1CC88_THET1|nr:glycine cleavage system protein GcvH [Thermobaculum terrenum]ACZ42403.1 glycine cleavage system H protein [Thermobaculum terrenum ATCC BAA-798]